MILQQGHVGGRGIVEMAGAQQQPLADGFSAAGKPAEIPGIDDAFELHAI